MTADRRQLDIERDEQWLRGFPKPCPSSETLERVKLAVRQACAGDDGRRIPGIDEALAAAKSAVREELSAARTERRPLLVFRRWVPVTAAAVVGFALIGDWRGYFVGGAEDVEIRRLADVMDRDPDDAEATLMALALDIADLEADAFGTVDAMWNESLLDGMGDALDDLLSDQSGLRETS